MHIAVDAAGHDQQSGSVNLTRALLQLFRDGDDLAAARADVDAEAAGCGHNLATVNNKLIAAQF